MMHEEIDGPIHGKVQLASEPIDALWLIMAGMGPRLIRVEIKETSIAGVFGILDKAVVVVRHGVEDVAKIDAIVMISNHETLWHGQRPQTLGYRRPIALNVSCHTLPFARPLLHSTQRDAFDEATLGEQEGDDKWRHDHGRSCRHQAKKTAIGIRLELAQTKRRRKQIAVAGDHDTWPEIVIPMGAYSYVVNDSDIIDSEIGNFCSIAAHVRINPGNHPTWRASQHHFQYRAANYQLGEDEAAFFDWRRNDKVVIGHDVWIDHGAIILAGATIGNGSVVGAGPVVSKDVAPYTIVGGVAAKAIRRRFPQKTSEDLQALAWWDWPHEKVKAALDDFRALSADAFIQKDG